MSALKSGQTVQIELKVLGQKLILKSDADLANSKRAVDFISQRVIAVEKRLKTASGTTSIPPMHVALLALLELGQEYIDAKDRVAAHQSAMNQLARQILNGLEAQKAATKNLEAQLVPSTPGLTIEASKTTKKKKSNGTPRG